MKRAPGMVLPRLLETCEEVNEMTSTANEPKIKRPTLEQLTKAFKLAKSAAIDADPGDGLENDGGTCNFDTPTVCLHGMREAAVLQAAQDADVSVTSMKWCGRKRYFLDGFLRGQALRRTRMMEAALRALREFGLDAMGYYHAD